MPSSDELKQILGIEEKNPTQLVFILDKSGSMSTLKHDAIGGFNAFLDAQKAIPDPARLTLVLFSNNSQTVYSNRDLNEAPQLNDTTYVPAGGTALYDAVGDAIDAMDAWIATLPEAERPTKVLFNIMTDGEENSSRRVSSEDLKAKIASKTESGWEFIFLGANQDAILAARTMGISKSVAYNTAIGADGHAGDTLRAYHVMGMTAMAYRSGESFAAVDGLHIDDETTGTNGTSGTTTSN